MNNPKRQVIIKKGLFLLAIVVCFVALGFYFGQRQSAPSTSPAVTQEEIARLAKPIVETEVKRKFEFPIGEAKDEGATFKLTLVDAKKVKLVATRGEPVQTRAGEEFLIIAIEIENSSGYPLKVDSQGYIRLLGDEEKKYAPDFYNGPIEIPADSVKRDELGFVVSADKNQFKLIIGPVDGEEKEEIEINF